MEFKFKPSEIELLRPISKVADSLHYPTYVVGGFVRDRLLGRSSIDLDIVCIGSGIELASAVQKSYSPKPPLSVFKRFGTAMIKHPDMEIEFVGARKESYRADSRKPTVEDGSLTDDQNRRDFTINAMAVQINEDNFGQLIDPFNGINDLKSGIIRTPLESGKTFSDDPLRMMRAIRFASQLNFSIEEETFKAIGENKERIKIISQERITSEINKIILSKKPSVGFKLLFDSGLLHIIFPKMVALHGVEIRNGQGHKDNFYHTLEVLDNVCEVSEDLWLRWAAILHDIAKPPTKRFNDKVGWTFHGHDGLGAAMVPRIFKRFRLPLDHKMRYVQKLVKLHLRPISLTKENISDSAIRRLLYEAGEDIEDLMTLCRADITSKNPRKVQRYLSNYEMVQQKIVDLEERDELRNWQPPIDGATIMKTFNLQPSREVGILKDAIREAILDGDISNNYDDAFAMLLRLGMEKGLEVNR